MFARSTTISGRLELILLGNTTQQFADRQLAGCSIALAITRGTIEQKTYTGLGHEQPFKNQPSFQRRAARKEKVGLLLFSTILISFEMILSSWTLSTWQLGQLQRFVSHSSYASACTVTLLISAISMYGKGEERLEVTWGQ